MAPQMANGQGSFPEAGPVTYLTDDLAECRRLLLGPLPRVKRWFHGTTERAARLACFQGIVPGCWIGAGGQSCGVLGHDSLHDFLDRRRYQWIIEAVGPALNEDLKAWWVPPGDIRGVWRLGTFYLRSAIAATHGKSVSTTKSGCACGLSELCAEQQRLWRATWPDDTAA